MFNKKLSLLFAISAFGFIVSSTITGKDSNFNFPVIKDGDYIVLFKDGKNIQDFKNEISIISKDIEIKEVYGGIVNGARIKASNFYMPYLESLNSISKISENKYHEVKVTNTQSIYDSSKTFYEPLTNNSVKELNIPESNKGGEGTLIAILDSSFSLTHEAFTDLDTDLKKKLTKEKVDTIVKSSDFRARNLDQYYYNDKVPYYHDYGGDLGIGNSPINEDSNVASLNSNHGMHVASIATANGTFTGVAPNAQLAFMKVFGDYSDGSQGCFDSMLVSALNDAYLLGADVINLSLGAALNEFEDSPVYAVLERLENEGVTVSAAVTNEGKGLWKNSGIYAYNTTEVVEDGVIGSYARSDSVTGVASYNIFDDNDGTYVSSEIAIGEDTIYGEDQLTNVTNNEVQYKSELHFYDLIPEGQKSVKLPYVIVPGVGSIQGDKDTNTHEVLGNDYEGLNVEGKIVVVKRGRIEFSTKVKNAKEHGAIGIIVTNDSGLGDISRFDLSSLAQENYIPVFSGKQDDFEKLEAAENKEITITKTLISDFSTNGTTADLRIATEISTPGQNVAGAINIPLTGTKQFINNGYAYMSGTSMAAPNYTGSIALILGEQDFADEEDELAYKKSLEARTMTTAKPIFQANGSPASVRRQGAGSLNVSNLLSSNQYLTSEDGKGKIELKNNFDIASGKIKFSVNLINENSESGSYKAKLYISAPEITELDKETYPKFGDVKLQTIKNKLVDTYEFDVALNGKEIQKIDVSYDLSDETKKYLTETFENGNYIEGYLMLTPNQSSLNELSIPYLGFYGDYNKQDAVEPFTFEREEGKTYASDLLNNLLQVTGAQKENVNYNSLIGVTGNDISTSKTDDIFLHNVDPAKEFTPILNRKIGDTYHLYAGSRGLSNNLYIQQYVSRNVKSSKVTLTNEAGEDVYVTRMKDSLIADETDTRLYKSLSTVSIFSQNYLAAHRAYAIIRLKDRVNGQNYADGTYKLKFEYDLLSGDKDTKEYVLHINEDPEPYDFIEASFVDKDVLTLTFNKEMFEVKVAGIDATLAPTTDGKYTYTFSLKEHDLTVEDNVYITYVGENYGEISGILAENGNGIMWSKTAQDGGSVALQSAEYIDPENSINGIQYRVSYYNRADQRLQLPRDAYITIFSDYDSSTVKCYRVSNGELKEMESADLKGATRINLDGVDTFILTGSVSEKPSDPTEPQQPSNDLTWLWITLGTLGGAIIIGGGVILVYLIVKKKK